MSGGGNNDLGIVAIVFILMVTYGTFLFMYSNSEQSSYGYTDQINKSDYNTPNSGNFFDQVENVKDLNVDNPEIFFINSMIFGTLGLLVAFVGLRFLRGS